MAYSPYKMKGHTLPGIKQVKSNKTKNGRAGSSAFQKKSDLDSIDNNRHAPARTKDTVDPADVKRREKKNTSKRVPTDKEARAEAVKNLYKPKSPAKKTTNKKAKIKGDLKGGREMLAAKKNPGKPKKVGTSIYSDTYQGTGETRSTKKAEKKFAKAEKKLAKGKLNAAARKVKKGRKTVVSMPSGPTTRSIAKKKGCKKGY